jgi:hypothetical protein
VFEQVVFGGPLTLYPTQTSSFNVLFISVETYLFFLFYLFGKQKKGDGQGDSDFDSVVYVSVVCWCVSRKAREMGGAKFIGCVKRDLAVAVLSLNLGLVSLL